jgi:hypothetical protein
VALLLVALVVVVVLQLVGPVVLARKQLVVARNVLLPGLCYHCHAIPAGHIAKDCPLKGLSKEAARTQATKAAKHKKAQ